MPRILVVDDEPKIVRLVRDYLEHAGFAVIVARDGREALMRARAEHPDLVVLDLGLPGLDGLDVTRTLRRDSAVPLIMLTARDSETDRVLGLELGADDYLTKPFSPRELVARVRAVLRRVRAAPVAGSGRVLRGGPLQVDLSAMTATVNGAPVELTPTEYRLLVSLVERKGRVQSRRQLLQTAWDIQVQIETRTVDMHIQRLRSKLGEAGDLIETVRGFGYRFKGTETG